MVEWFFNYSTRRQCIVFLSSLVVLFERNLLEWWQLFSGEILWWEGNCLGGNCPRTSTNVSFNKNLRFFGVNYKCISKPKTCDNIFLRKLKYVKFMKYTLLKFTPFAVESKQKYDLITFIYISFKTAYKAIYYFDDSIRINKAFMIATVKKC